MRAYAALKFLLLVIPCTVFGQSNEEAPPIREPASSVHYTKEKEKEEEVKAPAPPPEQKPNKNQYNLFNPVPEKLRRDFDSDRPGITDSPRTIDAGHIQMEADLFSYSHHRSFSRNDSNQVVTTDENSYSTGTIGFGIGLTNSTELQIQTISFESMTVKTSEGSSISKEHYNGVGDTTVRLKWNLFGNDNEGPALGLIPELKIPTNSSNIGNHDLEGAISLPLSIMLPNEWNFNIMPKWFMARNDDTSGYHAEMLTGISLGHHIVGDLSGYGEFISQSSSSNDSGWGTSTGAGVMYNINNRIQLDVSVDFGLNAFADEFNFSTGFVIRF